MKKVSLICPEHKIPLKLSNKKYSCRLGCEFPIKNNIPRFIESEKYSSSFGLQWQKFRLTQLDSYNGTIISHDRLKRLLGGSFEPLKDKTVLEAGCGAGRFTEILLENHAKVIAFDLSRAVEANYCNFKNHKDYFIIQADVLKLPFKPNSFDFVFGIGFIQHTPNPEETIQVLCSYLKPGGMLVVDHYAYGYAMTFSRRILRSFLIQKNPEYSLRFIEKLVAFLWPCHRFLWKVRNFPYMNKIRQNILKISPVVDYYDAYFELGEKRLHQFAILDTHDTLTDYYKHLRSPSQIKNYLNKIGMQKIESYIGGNGVEARAIKPKR